ncbi:MAG: hypothetical protein ACEY3D_03150 [Rickettsia sp.]
MIETFLCHSCVRGCMALKKAFYVIPAEAGIQKKAKLFELLILKI